MAKRYGELADALDELSTHLRLEEDEREAYLYQRAASTLRTEESIPVDPSDIDGVDKSARDEIAEWRSIGEITRLEKLREQRPWLSELTRIAKVGPKTAQTIHEETGASDIEDIRELADDNELKNITGIGSKTATTIRRSIAQLE